MMTALNAAPHEFETRVMPQFKSSTLGSWLGGKANNIWNVNMNPYLSNFSPWPSLSYSYYPPKESPEALERKRRLHEDLALLAQGTVLMGRPERTTPPKYGVIARQRVSKVHSPCRTKESAETHPDAPSSRNAIPHAHHTDKEGATGATTTQSASFEIRTFASPLPAALAEFGASVTPLTAGSLDDDDPDENKPPLDPFEEEAPKAGVLGEVVFIPEPGLRVKREPFAVLHLAEEKPRPATTEKGAEVDERNTLYETGSPCTSDSKGDRPKGLIRLRAKAPAAIDMDLINKALEREREESVIADTICDSADSIDLTADSKEVRMDDRRGIPNAPMMSNVPLPPSTPATLGSRVINRPVELALVVPIQRPKLPITPRRQTLLDILNGNSSLGRRKEV